MSIARILDGKLSATLALIMIIGWLVVDVVDAYPVARPDLMMVAIIIALAVVAFKFYQEDRASGKDPATQKAQLDAAVEIFLEKLAKHRALDKQVSDGEENPLIQMIRLLEKYGASIEESEDSEELPDIITDDREEAEAKGDW